MSETLRWLITGGCGFIGINLINLIGKDTRNRIRIVDNLSVGSKNDLATVCQFDHIQADSEALKRGDWSNPPQLIVGDILDDQLADFVTKGADVIIHLAANTGVAPSVENPRQDCFYNVIGTLNYLEAARTNGIKRFVFASSGAPVGETIPPIHEELPAHPVSPYGASKLAGEGYCSAYFRTFGIETVALRFGNVYGPRSGHKSSLVAKFIRQVLNGETLEIYGNGKQTRDFIYIGDLVQAIILGATKDKVGGEIFQIATNAETTVNELSEKLFEVLKASGIKEIKVKNASARLGDVMRNFSDTSKAKNILGWESKTELEEGLQKTVDWFLDKK
ncbi:MAG: GDP-mannose 4,6-dehydratase [Deltaproteobacteria bacterium]|nr:GDP-mannose 4,6-dehydratase [Deltaproteobacteria bacterium]